MRATTNLPVQPGDEHLQGLTKKQRKFTKAIVHDTDSLSEATRMAGYDTLTPSHIGNQNLNKLYVRQAILAEMEKSGVTNEKLTQRLNEGLDATKVQTSPTEPDKTIPDHVARHKYLETALKLKDAYPNDKRTVEHKTANINTYVNLTPQQREKLKEKLGKEIEGL